VHAQLKRAAAKRAGNQNVIAISRPISNAAPNQSEAVIDE